MFACTFGCPYYACGGATGIEARAVYGQPTIAGVIGIMCLLDVLRLDCLSELYMDFGLILWYDVRRARI